VLASQFNLIDGGVLDLHFFFLFVFFVSNPPAHSLPRFGFWFFALNSGEETIRLGLTRG
jgi:hypothetical protein